MTYNIYEILIFKTFCFKSVYFGFKNYKIRKFQIFNLYTNYTILIILILHNVVYILI